MAKSALSVLSWIALLEVALASPAADPLITPAPLVKRQGQQLVGYYASDVVGGTTYWGSETCNVGYTFTSVSNYFKCCTTAGACNIFTGCSGSTLVGAGTSANCATFGVGAFCSYDLLYPQPGVLTAQSYFWCGTLGDTGTNIFKVTNPAATTEGSSPTSGSGSSGGSSGGYSGGSGTTAVSSTQTSATVSPVHKSTPVGAIAGGVVGGLAIIGLIAAGVVFLLLRKKKENGPTSQQPMMGGGAMPPPQQQPMAMNAGNGQYPPNQGVYGVAPPPEQQNQGYYGYDNKAISPAPSQQPYGVSPAGSPNPLNTYPANPHDSMYKPPIQQQSPPQPYANTFELPSPAPVTTPSPQAVPAQVSQPMGNAQPNGPVELSAPLASPPPRYSNLGPSQ